MNTAPDDAAEITPPRDPASYGPRRRAAPAVWLVAAICLIGVAAGVAIMVYGPQIGPFRHAPAAEVAPAASPAPDRTPRAQAPPTLSGGFDEAPAAPDPQLAALETRVRALETAQARTIDAAAAALASALLAEAAESSRPFENELAALERVLPMSPDALALRRLAQTGAPTRAALAASFDDAAAKAVVAARRPGENAGVLARIGHALSAIVTIRRVGSAVGDGPDAVLTRAERQVGDGDIDGALDSLGELSPEGQEAMAAWRAGAERRAEIDRRVAAIRAAALADLAQVARNRS